MNKLVADIRSSMQKVARSSGPGAKKKNKYEYDSDEDIDDGTWEHKARAKEMLETYGMLE